MAKELTKDEKIIVRGYKEGLKNIRKDINLLYEKYAKDGKLSMADLSKYNRLTNLEKNIADNLKTAYDVQVKTTKKAVKGAFESAFYYGTFELEQEAKMNLMFGLLKKEAVNAVVEGPNRWPQIAKGHTKLTNAKIRDQIMQGVVQGKDAGQVTKAIAKEMNIAASKACRIVRTETHRAQNQGSLDSYTEAYKKGVLIQKVWVATLDDRTRDSHRVMDGQVVEVYEDFIMPGDIKASAPGLSGSASGDINCRCTIRAEVVGFTPQARRARGDGIIPQQTYQQWAKSKGIPFNKDMADEVKKLLEARGASKAVIQKASVENFSKFVNVDYQEDYKEELMPIYEKFAKKRGLTLAEYEKEATDKLEKLIKNADIQVNVKPETLLSIVNNGSFKTLSELGTASGRTEKYIANRVKIEKMIFDQNDGKIIYGTLQDKTLREIHTEGLTGYGDIKIILNKDKLGDVTTFTGCDSSFAFSTGVSSFKKPSIYFQSTLDVDKVQDILDSSITHINHLGADRRFYIEAQVHKKVLLEEIEEVIFKDKQSLSKELADALDKNKIKYRVANEHIGRVDLSKYDQQHKDAAFWFEGRPRADNALRKQTGELWKTLSSEEREALYTYTSGSGKFNRPLRGYEGSWQNYKGIGQVDLDCEGGKAMIEAATKALDRCSYDFDIWLQRGVESSDGAAAFLGIKTSELALSEKELQDLLIDKVVKDEAFLSTSACKGLGFSGDLIVNLYAPRGTKMIYAEPFSCYGRGAKLAWDGEAKQSNFGSEFEVIIQRGSSYKITKLEKVGSRIFVDVDVFPPEL